MSSSDPIPIVYGHGDASPQGVQEIHDFIQSFVERQQLLPRSAIPSKEVFQEKKWPFIFS